MSKRHLNKKVETVHIEEKRSMKNTWPKLSNARKI